MSSRTMREFVGKEVKVIQSNQSIHDAQNLMATHRIRHLPVVEKGKLFGILSDRDVKLACGIYGYEAANKKVSEICSVGPYAVTPDNSVREVAAKMGQNRYGCVLIVEDAKVIGIFTTVDACRLLSELIDQ